MSRIETLEKMRDLPGGDYAECGVYKGDSAVIIAAHMSSSATLWLFDSFQGHAEPCEFDDTIGHPKGRYADNSITEVQARCPGARIVAGYVPQTLSIVENVRFRFVRIDVDHYLPTKAACEFFKPRMVPNGIMEFDDYESLPGAKKAVDEVFGVENVHPPHPYWWKAP